MTELSPAVRLLVEVELGVVALGVVVGVLCFVAILLRTIFDRSALVSPRKFKQERSSAERGKGGLELDCAWPWYLRRQVYADETRIHLERRAVDKRLWAWLGEPLFRQGTTPGQGKRFSPLWLLVPYPVVVLPFLVAVALASLACLALYLVAMYLVLGVSWILYAATVGTLRAGEAGWLRFRHASASCPHCFYVSERPAYRCSDCGELHRDIRPGRLGVFERRCQCGQLMPTMVLRAAWHETAVCQRCGEPLREGAAALRDVRIPIFGDVSAGKTRLLYASLDSISTMATRNGIAIGYSDPESRQLADLALATIRSAGETTKTDPLVARALSFRLGNGNNGTLVHFYDAAGELYRDSERYDEVSFLDHGHGLVFVVDPFALPAIRDRVAGRPEAAGHLLAGADKDPGLAYDKVVGQLRDGGTEASSQRLAIVVSKADVLAECGIEVASDSAEISAWLYENGLHNVVLAAANEFAAVRYFAVASLAAEDGDAEADPGAPFRWLLRSQGVPLPAEAARPAVGEATG